MPTVMYQCPNAKDCPKEFKSKCDHAHPHKWSETHGCGNVICNKRDNTTAGAAEKMVREGERPALDCACQEVK